MNIVFIIPCNVHVTTYLSYISMIVGYFMHRIVYNADMHYLMSFSLVAIFAPEPSGPVMTATSLRTPF